MDKVLDVKGLKTNFYTEEGLVKAVDDLSFHINKGECVALVGESGCGKSASAMSILRLIPYPPGVIESGEIFFKGENLLNVSEERIREVRGNEISMIFQEPMTSLNPVLKIGFQICEAIVLHQGKTLKEAEAITLEMLRLVRIPEPEKQMDQYPHQLSGGMRQRAMIAMALCCRPSLLIADEPTTALDVSIQAQILDLIKMLQKEIGMSVMFVTHDMGVVAEMADRVVVMLGGKKVEEGPVQQIFKNPQHPYTIALLDAVPRLGSMTGRSNPEKFANIDIRRAEGDQINDAQSAGRTTSVAAKPSTAWRR